MRQLIRNIRAERIKLRHTCFLPVHIFAPLLAAVVFLLYFSLASWDPMAEIKAYYVVIGICFPVIASLLCALVTDQELHAGNYQLLLFSTNRVSMFFSKWLLLFLYGCGALFWASILFGIGNMLFLQQHIVSMTFYFIAAICLMTEGVVLYTLHLFVAMCFNKGVTIMLGIAEGLLSALCRTGLGDSKWFFLPCAWPTRFIENYALLLEKGQLVERNCYTAICCCILMSVLSLLTFGIWCKGWEGMHTED